jgi:hypothetical protein
MGIQLGRNQIGFFPKADPDPVDKDVIRQR